jgi:hypothetical protein
MIKSNGGVFGRNPTFQNITVDGTMSVNSSITLASGNLIVASGNGIDFSATANGSGTVSSELLNDYEVGTWSPVYKPVSGTFTTMTMDINHATYVKVGRIVTVAAWIRTNDVNITGGSSSLRIGGLPFTVFGGDAGCVGYTAAWAVHPFGLYTVASTSDLTVTKRGATTTAAITDAVPADLTTGTTANQNRLIFTCTYFVA